MSHSIPKKHFGDVLLSQSLSMVLKKTKRNTTKADKHQQNLRYNNTK